MAVCAGLTPYEIDVLEVLSLFYMPVRLTKLADALKGRGARDENNRVANQKSLLRTLARLEKAGLVYRAQQAYFCDRSIVELVTRRMIEAGRFAATEPLVRALISYKPRWGDYVDFASTDHAIANVRLALYPMDFKRLKAVLVDIDRCDGLATLDESPVSTIIKNPFDGNWLAHFPAPCQSAWISDLLHDLAMAGEPAEDAVAYLHEHMEEFDAASRQTASFAAAEIAFLQGHFDEALDVLDPSLGISKDLLHARHHLLIGSPAEAVARYEACLTAMKKATGKRKPKFPTADWLYFILALLDSDGAGWPRALELAQWGTSDNRFYYSDLCKELETLIKVESGIADSDIARYIPWGSYTWREESSLLLKLFRLLLDCWLKRDTVAENSRDIEELCERARTNGYPWLEAEFAELLHQSGCRRRDFGKRAESLRSSMNIRSLVSIIRPVEDWERALKALAGVEKSAGSMEGQEKTSRLVWFLHGSGSYWEIQPKEQKANASGRWSKGRNISLQRLYQEGESLGFLSAQDIRACKRIAVDTNRGYWKRMDTTYHLPMDVLAVLAGHPHVYLAATGANVDVVAANPELEVSKTTTSFELKLIPPKPEGGNIHVELAGDARLIVYEYTPDICRVARILGKGVAVPAKARDEVLKAVGHVSSMVTIHSDIGVGDESIPKVDADATPVLQLLPAGEGLIVQLRVQPLPEGGPLFAPGSGGEAVIAEVGGARMQTERDFKAEKQQAGQVIDSCPTLSGREAWEGEWRLEDPEACLEFLMELQACTAAVRVQWPKGQKYGIRGTAGLGQFRAKINGGHNWFELSGEVQVDNDLVLDMQRLLELTESSRSRFVSLGEGQFVALTQAFRKKLDELRGVSEACDGGLRMHALAAPVLDDLVAQAASVKANKQWKEQVQRLQRARDLDPKIPSTLRATLRDYQIDGYKWLARLAEWGVGACLADDMGLGKTVQILAVMLNRAAAGPQLVIAPTSVCMNWEEEAIRFAPTLKIHQFGAGNREELMAYLGPFDVVVSSYGLLHSANELFKQVEWQTIVLDEAQAIKNMATKRSKAAMDLTGAFRIISTGTPIENHLGELWNLYRFINPGFLGSLNHFNTRFALPIEKYQDKDTRHHLKQLIQPFILRRLKGDVLDELPPRTDIVLHVELSKEEQAFYEALRLQALEQLNDVKDEPGKHHVRILAEIMRLRRACCNTQLIDENSTLPSAKLEVFEAVLDELMENRHKALVFSQFVGHLSIIRKRLDKKGVTYQYLDGSTPAKDRKKAVDAFQAGEGELFLISLKAGGTGLNLTAADYVIHMDPWWNPAVEDQASDRAHRIGQQRPVTVYRLVAKNTIEDQIVDLHHQKRDLANSLLEGSDMAGKISADQLLTLLRNG